MAEISKITLPSGNTYDIKDAGARDLISQLTGISFIVAWNGSSTPVVANIPAGVVVTYNDTDYTGTLAANSASAGAFYLVYSTTSSVSIDIFDEYVAVGATGSKTWERIGSTSIDLSTLGALAYKDSVSLNKGAGDVVLGEGTTFTTAASEVTFSGGTTDTFVKSVSAETGNKLVTTEVPNVTSVGSASSWAFEMGTGNDAETLIVSGNNGSAPTLGTAITAATGSVDANGTGAAVVTGVTIGQSGSAVTSVGTATAAAQTVTVGTNDKVNVAKYNDLSVSVS